MLAALLCFNFSIFGQSSPQDPDALAKTYTNYFSLNREAVFLHFNKTIVAPNEDIWFSAYSYSPQFYLPNLTTNLLVNLYNREGKLMESKTISLTNAHGEGFFELKAGKYPPGEYLIRAGTKYMENFREEAFFSQSISILGETGPGVEPEYDLQLLPEGGHLVANVDNSVGVKLINNKGKGVAFKEGRILNSRDEEINTLQSNRFGISKFRFTPTMGEKYTISIKLEDGTTIRKPVPQPDARGIVMSGTALGDKVLFTIKTNSETFPSLKDQNFLFAIHKDGAMKALDFVFSEIDMSANVTLTQDALYNGVNTITVFNDKFEPLLERLIFNRDSIHRKDISARIKSRNRDSLVVSLSSMVPLDQHSMSVSVLPAGTKSYDQNNNIFSAFYIEPYIQGDLENGGYYFSEEVEPRRRDYDLDLLLLTQGWSKYSWKNIFNTPPRELYAHEHGFTLTGNVVKRNAKNQKTLFISSPADNLSVMADIADNNSFKAENIFVNDSSRVTFSLMNDRNSNISDPGVVVNIFPVRQHKDITPPSFLNVNLKSDSKEEELAAINNDFILGAESLETVFLESTGKTLEEENRDLERKLNRADMYGKTEVFTREEAMRYSTIFSYLLDMGFEARGNNIYTLRELMRKPLNTSIGQPAQPTLVFIDGMESNLNELRPLRPTDVESIYTNKTGAGARGFAKGGATAGGLIEIVTKKTYAQISKSATNVILKHGFAAPREFYAPRYNSYNDDLYVNYGTIAWFPQIFIEGQSIDLKVFDTRLPLKVFIEGMTTEGALISEEILLKN